MQKELYDQIQKDYSDYKRMVNKDYEELEELENNPIVKRYKYLLQLKDDIARTNFYDGKNPDFICEVINRYGKGLITETLNIWAWFLNISVGKYEEIFKKTLEGMDKDGMISVYIDIENSKVVKVIPLEQKDTFEKENRVVKGNMSIYDASDRYYNTRYKFFKLYVNEGEDIAVKTIIEQEKVKLTLERK